MDYKDYEPSDLGKLEAGLRGARGISSDAAKRSAIAEVNAAALIDIARSLQVLALEVVDVHNIEVGYDVSATVGEDDDSADYIDNIDEGDRVEMVMGPMTGTRGTVQRIGVDQGEPFAVVSWDVAQGAPGRVYTRNLARIVDEPEPPADEPADEEGDDLEADFSAPADALAELERREAKGKKKGKKA